MHEQVKVMLFDVILVVFFSTHNSEFNHKPYFRVLSAYLPYQELLMLFDDDNFEDLYDDNNFDD